ncbi:carbamoyl-phosphate synthase L chain, ATP binding domain-containing protein [Syncephalis fuscata]|nr:carbamoyl-phosphate synthase L chain, ATP binding domain-containing protein [Syncephalis fuscata]
MFHKILVANRGEIACRVLRTCRRLGIATVAVYSDSDKEAPHTKLADEAVYIGPSPATESYLRGDLIIAVAKQTGADALHPGYGFLSENAEFAQACMDANIKFIGPKPSSINAIGDKISAKQLLKAKAPKVPLIPGYNGDDQSNERLVTEAVNMGFPVLLKASAGGGGKGMRIVREKEHLMEEIELAKSEARRSFGSDALLVERYFDRGRHIEIQIIGDQQGNVHHIYERECTIQRRHQKIIEESPSPIMTDSLRSRMTDAAICIGQLIDYEGVGTVEFIVDDATHDFFFLEVNTRLQVEHPVTESVTGLDLVELQIHVAAGGSLKDTSVPTLPIKGYAMECRLYAEDPSQNYMPCSGPVLLWQPSSLPFIRYDTGSMVTIYYDPMIAKVTVWAETRDLVIKRMERALHETLCLGLVTNQDFLLAVLRHSKFRQGQFTTQFVEQEQQQLLALEPITDQYVTNKNTLHPLAQATLAAHLWRWYQRKQAKAPLSFISSGYRNVRWRPQYDRYTTATIGDIQAARQWEIAYTHFGQRGALKCWLPRLVPKEETAPLGRVASMQHQETQPAITAEIINVTPLGDNQSLLRCCIDGVQRNFYIVEDTSLKANVKEERRTLWLNCASLGLVSVRVGEHNRLESHTSAAEDSVLAYTTQMPCRILRLIAANGQTVKPGDTILTMESMKMETKLLAKHAGTVHLLVKSDQLVAAGVLLCEIK